MNMNAKKLIGYGVLALCMAATAMAGSFSAYAQAYPLPNYYAGQVTVPSTGSVTQAAQAFTQERYYYTQVINEGPLGYWLLQSTNTSNPSINNSGSCNAGTYNYEVEVVPSTYASGYSVVTISW
jgi:hypothetical protein